MTVARRLAIAKPAVALACALAAGVAAAQPVYFDVSRGAHPHDVAAVATPGGPVYYTAQATGRLGMLDPKTGRIDELPLGARSAPHGVIVGPDGAAWITDSGQNAILRVDPATRAVRAWPLPADTGYANLNTATFDRKGRVWSDSRGRIWVSYWNTGHVGMYDPASRGWREWKLPGSAPRAYSVWVDDKDKVWLTEWTANAIVRFDPVTEKFASFPSTRANATVRQMLGRAGEAWGAESGNDRLVMIPAP